MPFTNEAGTGPARVLLQQVGTTRNFKLAEPFRYVDPTDGESYLVKKSDPGNPKDVTDLASVPWPLWWLIASYGQHTLAALLHDSLITDKMELKERVKADTVFFRALEESGNNWLRHRLMWAGVSVGGTMWKKTRVRLVLFLAHILVFWAAALWWIGGVLQGHRWFHWLSFGGRLPLDRHHSLAGVTAIVAFVLGVVVWRYARTADPQLAWWMWAVGALGVGLIAVPVFFIALSIAVVTAIDWTVAVLKWVFRQGWERPSPIRPTVIARMR